MWRNRASRSVLLVFACLGVIPNTSAAEKQYEFIDLGELNPVAINEQNRIAGTMQYWNAQHVGVWQESILTDLGVLPGGNFSYGYDMNEIGQIVGYANQGTSAFGVLWQGSTATILNPLPGDDWSQAVAINNAGVVIGRSEGRDPVTGNPLERAVIWNGAEAAELPGLSGAGFLGDDGVITGYSTDALGQLHAVIWKDGVAQEILPPPGYTNLYVGGISAQGLTAVSLDDNVVLNNEKPALWDGQQFIMLDTLSGGAGGVGVPNATGDAVGYSRLDTGGSPHAVLWSGGSIYDLNQYLPEGSDWELISASDINDKGWIVGVGLREETRTYLSYGFLLRPLNAGEEPGNPGQPGGSVVPEPSSLILLGSGLLGLFGFKRRSSR